jgi:hypothetical protein
VEHHQVADTDDTSALWRALLQAKADGDHRLVRAIEGRMRELSGERRFAHLSDEELRRQIAGLTRQREPEGMLGHSPGGGGWGGGFDTRDTMLFNEAHRRDQHAGIEETLAALQAERDRREARRQP